jgi:uncharacterized membrane protein YbhN (UPF0104 family)
MTTVQAVGTRRNWWPWLRLGGGAALLTVLLWRLGTGPFLDGLTAINATTAFLALGIGLVTTVCSAWRWTLVAGGLGIGLPLRQAVTAYYRSQFLNTTLPGGVLGDVHRGVRHGREVDDLGRGLRAVAGERIAGQIAFVGLAVTVLIGFPSPVQSLTPVVILVLAAVGATVFGLTRLTRKQPGWWGRMLRIVSADVRDGLLERSVWPKVLFASIVVVCGHTLTFLLAARGTGTAASLTQLLPVTVLVLLAMVVPLNIGGWGPREGMAAWAFAASGLGASQGVAAATLYGVLALVAAVPGLAVLIDGLVRRRVAPGKPLRIPAGDAVDPEALAHG